MQQNARFKNNKNAIDRGLDYEIKDGCQFMYLLPIHKIENRKELKSIVINSFEWFHSFFEPAKCVLSFVTGDAIYWSRGWTRTQITVDWALLSR